MLTARRAGAGLTLGALVLLLGAGGCARTASEQQLAEIRSNPSPGVDTLTERPDDIDNALTMTFDSNFRQLNSDLGRALLLDRPSRLTRLPSR